MEAKPRSEPVYLPISSVAEILYCPRNFYYRVMEGAGDSNAHVLEGKLQEEKRERRGTVIRAEGVQVRSVSVSSETLGLIGVVDCLEERDAWYPVEYKKGALKDSLNDDVQLCAQAMVLEEKLGRDIEKGYIYYVASRTRREVHFHSDLRALVENTIKRALHIMESGDIPSPVADSRCCGCALEPRCLPFETSYLTASGEKPARPVPGVNLGRVLYVDEQGAKIKKTGQRLLVKKEEQVLQDIPLCNIDQVVLVGGVNLTTPAIKMLLDQGIPVAYLTTGGKYRGLVEPSFTRNGLLRLAQFSAYFQDDLRLGLARRFVTGKLANMRILLMRHNRRVKSEKMDKAARNISGAIAAAARAQDSDTLLGVEGMASRQYFSVFSLLIKPGMYFEFSGRNRRPPRDPVNALLSYAYTLLLKDIQSAVQVAGFDPYVGYLHHPVYGRPALALDLMEEFRPIVADSSVLSAINRGVVGEEDFAYQLGGCFLNAAGRKKFYKCYQERLRSEISHPVFNYKLPYLRVFELQARFLGKVLQKELKEYIPFVVR